MNPINRISLLLALLGLASCSGGGGGGGGELRLSAAAAVPGEVVRLSHGSLTAGRPVDVEFDVAGARYTLPFTPQQNGSLAVAFPPVLDPETGRPVQGDASVGIAGVDQRVDIRIGGLPELPRGIAPGTVCDLIAEQTLANLDRVRDDLEALEDRDAGLDLDAAFDELADSRREIEDLRDRLASGSLELERVGAPAVDVGRDELLYADRWLLQWIVNLADETSFSGDDTLVRAASTPVSEDDLRRLIAAAQLQAGRSDLNAQEIEQALLGVGLGVLGAPNNAAGTFFSALGVLVSAGQIAVTFRGSQMTIELTANALNGDRIAHETLGGRLKNGAALVLGAVAIIAGIFKAPVIAAAAATFGLGMGFADLNTAVIYGGDVNVHIPARHVEFSEIRVQSPGSFEFPRFEVSLADDPGANAYDLLVYGMQQNGEFVYFNPMAWRAMSIARQHKVIPYGSSNFGELNSAAGLPGTPPIPAPSLADFRMWGVFAQGLYDRGLGDPTSTLNPRGDVDIKYTDGPVVFTFELFPSRVRLNASGISDPVNVTARIVNGSSMALEIQGLEFEFAPGDAAFSPIYEGAGPLVRVEPGEDREFRLTSVRIDANTAWRGKSSQPRLVIRNSGFPVEQQFWSRMRSVQALSGAFEVVR